MSSAQTTLRDSPVGSRAMRLSPTKQRRRLDRRQAEEPYTTWHMTDEGLAEWAATISIPTRGSSTAANLSIARRQDSRLGRVAQTRWPPAVRLCEASGLASSGRVRESQRRSSSGGKTHPAIYEA
jgi:hypothetical protein